LHSSQILPKGDGIMATIRYFTGRPQHDWEVVLQDALANGTFSAIGTSETELTLTIGNRQIIFTGTGLMASAARTIDSGTITGIAIREAGQAVMSVTGLTSTTAADLQVAINGAGGLAPYSEEFKDATSNLVTGEFFNATGSAASDTILGTARVDNLNGGAGDDYMRGGGGVDTLAGGTGFDMLAYNFDTRSVGIKIDLARNTVVNNNAAAATVDRISGFEIVFATRFADNVSGTSGRNELYGEKGSDTLSGKGYSEQKARIRCEAETAMTFFAATKVEIQAVTTSSMATLETTLSKAAQEMIC
jgi:Ca2+-binding RTX toxin-like protein